MNEIEVRELKPELLQDWLSFFDHDAFVDNPEWEGCYCHFYHANHAEKDWGERSAAENRAASRGLILSGNLRGLLAYADGKPAGWCHAAPRLLIPNLLTSHGLEVEDAERVGSIVCFVVAPGLRRQGIARRLLDAACSGFAAQGLAIAEAYPRLNVDGDAANYHGPSSLYREAGFVEYRRLDRVMMVRKALSASGSAQPAI